METSFPAVLMRGGSSKGLFIAAADLPEDEATRDKVLLSAMGSPDSRQIDGVGGAHPLTSKIAIISRSSRADADVDYLFLQVSVDVAQVSPAQNCGNMLAGVGSWAIEHGLVEVTGSETRIRIHMLNTSGIAIASIPTKNGQVIYDGDTSISGVPGTAASIPIEFLDIAGSSTGALLPTKNTKDISNGIEVTCVDNGMPVILIRAEDLGVTGYETPQELEANSRLKEKVEAIRLDMAPKMNLGDASRKTIPKLSLISRPKGDGVLMTRTFIPHRVHQAIGVLGAVSVATGCALPGTVAEGIAKPPTTNNSVNRYSIEHPTGKFEVDLELDGKTVKRSALIRTARKLMSGDVYIPSSVWKKQ